MKNKDHIETILMHENDERMQHRGAVVPPIYQNSLFTFEDWDDIDAAFDDRLNRFIYSRGKNPTVNIVEQKIAALAEGEKAQLFPSGMAAISAACLHFLRPNDHVVTLKNIYGPASNFLRKYLVKKMNIEVTCVEGVDLQDFKSAIRPDTRLIYLESPATAVFTLQDIKAVATLARKEGINTVIDNTWATPLYQKPLAMGIDLEIHSCSKYLGGHSDLVSGVVIGKSADIDAIFHDEYVLLGSKVAPWEAWLLLRSLRSLPLRMARHQISTLEIAQFLEQNKNIKTINYPGLKTNPQYKLAKKQMSGFTGLLSFRLLTNDIEKIKKFVNSFEVFQLGVSWGGHESLIYAPAISYLKELDPDQFEAMGIGVGDIRLSIGLEHVDDLKRDLKQAFDTL